MDYRQLGRTGLRVSAFGMGCGNFGGVGSAPAFFGQGESESEAFTLLDRAVDLGINFFDTADAYGGGRSEQMIGRWLATKDAATRDRLLISSKVANPVGDDTNQRGLSRRHVLRQVEASMRNLGVDHLDMYLMHEPDPTTPLDETIDVFDTLVRDGKVRYIGASNLSAWLMTKALWTSDVAGRYRFDWIQNSYNLIDQAAQGEVLELCADQGLGFTPFGPLCGGWLTGKYRSGEDFPPGSRMTLRPEPYEHLRNDDVFAAIDRFADVADGFGVSMAGLAMAWLHHHPLVTAPIVGPRRPEQFEPVEEALDLALSPAEWQAVGDLFVGRAGE